MKLISTTYHPQTNGAKERAQRLLVEYLICYILEDKFDWDIWLPYATFVFNTTAHTGTVFTPHELLFGRKLNIPGTLQKETPEIPYKCDNYVKKLQARLQSRYEIARSNLQVKKEKTKKCHDRTVNCLIL